MNLVPERIERPDLQRDKIERTYAAAISIGLLGKVLTNLPEPFVVPRVRAVVDAMVRALQSERRPQRPEPLQPAAAEVSSWKCRNLKPFSRTKGVHPSQFADLHRRNIPPSQVFSDAKGTNEDRSTFYQLRYSGGVQMVIVIVREQN